MISPAQKTQRQNVEDDPGDCGLYNSIPFEKYIRWKVMSQSVLKRGRESMKHMKHAIDHLGTEKITDAMTLGSALHVAFLEPDLMPLKVVRWTGPRRAGDEWSMFKDEHAGKAILTPGMYERLMGMVKALRDNAEVTKWTKRLRGVELSAIDIIDDVKFKGRTDGLTDDPLLDLKKITSTDDRTINGAIDTYGYHIQAHIYCKLFKRDRFCLGFVEESPPHDVRVVELSPTWMKLGAVETTALIQRLKHCIKIKAWPGRSDKMEQIEPPDWKIHQSGLAEAVTIGEESAFG